MNGLLLALSLLAQSPPPLVSTEETAPVAAPVVEVAEVVETPVVEEGKDPVSRNTWRLHFSAGGGFLGFITSPGASSDAGGFISIGKPLYVGDRHTHHQWVTDSTVFIGYAPGTRTTLLIVTPTIGTNWYFGPVFGLEWRAGMGFGATPGANTNVGIGITIEGSIVLRPFKDDQKRIKLQGQEVLNYGFIGSLSGLISMGLGVAFEMPL